MKMHITREDLGQLSTEQRQNLNDLWIPEVYDIALARVCIDESNEEYGEIEFVVGGIQLLHHHSIILHDLKFLPDIGEDSENTASAQDDSFISAEDTDESYSDEFDGENELDYTFIRPSSFNKEECLPLLNIGQMIKILQKKGFGEGDFYLTVAVGDFVCDMGKHDNSWNSVDENAKTLDLCDVLWESIKAVL